MARTPAVGLPVDADFFRVALVEHVVFALVVWFLGFGVVLMCHSAGRLGELEHPGWGIGLLVACAGSGMLVAASLFDAQPLLIDYLPLLEHPLYFAGLLLLAAGVSAAVVAYISEIRKVRVSELQSYGMLLVGLITLITFLSFLSSAFINGTNYRALVWGPGHIFQVASTLAMVVAWLVLLRETMGVEQDSPLMRRLLLLYLAVAMLMPGIYFFPPWEQSGMFTLAMMYGVALPSVPVALLVLRALVSRPVVLRNPAHSSLLMSLLLFGTGGAMGFFATGADLRVPAHYHGVLGAVTLAFMGVTYLLLEELGRGYSRRAAMLQPHLYGAGLLLIILGLFWAGMRSAPRKTVEFSDQTASLAMNLMGLGSVVAVLGGAAFVVNVLLALLGTDSNRR